MTPFDRDYFAVGAKRLDFPAFSTAYALGMRTYISKEKMDNLDAARRKFFWLKVMHYASLVVYYGLIAAFYYLLLRKLGVIAF